MKKQNVIEGMFEKKKKLTGYVPMHRKDIAMVLALVKSLAYDFVPFIQAFISYFCHSYLGF